MARYLIIDCLEARTLTVEETERVFKTVWDSAIESTMDSLHERYGYTDKDSDVIDVKWKDLTKEL